MKKFVRMILLAAIAMTMCLSSCTKKPEKLIVGKWKVVSARCSDNNVKPWVIEAIGNDKGETWTFKENGTFVGFMNVLSSICGEVDCDYICYNNTIELCDGNLKGSWEGDRVNIVFTFDIDEISSKDLSIMGRMKITFTDDGYLETETVSSIKYELEKK